MTDLRAPQRWLERKTLAPELRRDLLAYGSAGPSSERRARMLAQLESELGTLDGSGAVSASAPGLFSSVPMKLTIAAGALVVGSLALLALLWPRSREDDAGRLVRSPQIIVPAQDADPREPTMRVVPVSSASAAPRVEARSPVTRAATRPSSPARAPEVRATSKRRGASADLERRETARAPRTAPQQSSALTELALLARARRALLVQPALAFELVEEHARTYPEGTFQEEREVLAIESLTKLRRIEEATQRARMFEERFPSSTHRAHLSQLVSRE